MKVRDVPTALCDRSMEPRHIGRGNSPAFIAWRPQNAASMEPRHIGRGNGKSALCAGSTSISFNGAASHRTRKL